MWEIMCLRVNKNDTIHTGVTNECVCVYNVHSQKLKGRIKVNINNLHIPISVNINIYY